MERYKTIPNSVSNIALYPSPNELNNELILLFYKIVLFKKIATVHEKVESRTTRGSISNVRIESANIYILSNPAHYNERIKLSIKWELENRGHVLFEPIYLGAICLVI